VPVGSVLERHSMPSLHRPAYGVPRSRSGWITSANRDRAGPLPPLRHRRRRHQGAARALLADLCEWSSPTACRSQDDGLGAVRWPGPGRPKWHAPLTGIPDGRNLRTPSSYPWVVRCTSKAAALARGHRRNAPRARVSRNTRERRLEAPPWASGQMGCTQSTAGGRSLRCRSAFDEAGELLCNVMRSCRAKSGSSATCGRLTAGSVKGERSRGSHVQPYRAGSSPRCPSSSTSCAAGAVRGGARPAKRRCDLARQHRGADHPDFAATPGRSGRLRRVTGQYRPAGTALSAGAGHP